MVEGNVVHDLQFIFPFETENNSNTSLLPRGAIITNLLNAASAMIGRQLKVFHYKSFAAASMAHFLPVIILYSI